MNLREMERLSVPLRRGRGGYTPITDVSIWDDVGILAGIERSNWRDVAPEGPTALLGGIAGLEVPPPTDPFAALTMSATEQALWATATYTPIPGLPRAPIAFELYASGTITTTATASPTVTYTPRWGLTNAAATLGASQQIALTASITGSVWQLRGNITLRAPGTGSGGRLYGTFQYAGKHVTAGNGAPDAQSLFGYTAATNDTSAATGLWMGFVSTITTPTITVQQIQWGSWN